MARHQPQNAQLKAARTHTGLSRERVAAMLEPPVSSKSLERWETPGTPVKRWRVDQLADIYGVPVESFYNGQVAA